MGEAEDVPSHGATGSEQSNSISNGKTDGRQSKSIASKEAKDFWKILQPQKPEVEQTAEEKPKDIQSVTSHSHPLSGYVAPMTYQSRREGLIVHIKHPEANENGLVIYYNDDWTLIQDLFPKSTVHYLLLPRNPNFCCIHPLQAFKNVDFLNSARQELNKALEIAAAELCRKLGHNSRAHQERKDAMLAEEPPDPLPPGRDWTKDFKIGVHALPSMSHVHIHILSKDNLGSNLKSCHHYNTNNTPFFVKLDELPLTDSDPRWHIVEGYYTEVNVKCWRCGNDFGRKFSKLKEHLKLEREEWSRE